MEKKQDLISHNHIGEFGFTVLRGSKHLIFHSFQFFALVVFFSPQQSKKISLTFFYETRNKTFVNVNQFPRKLLKTGDVIH